MKDCFLKLQSLWHICFPKMVYFFMLLKNLSLLWHHPFAALFILSLFTSPMQPIIRFFSPLIGCTLLCVVAYISFGFLVNKSKEMQIGDEIEDLDVLRLGGGWAATHGVFKQETDSTLFMEQLESTTSFPTKDESFDEDQLGKNGDFHLDSSPMTEIVLSSFKESKIVEKGNGFPQVEGLEQERDWDFEKNYDEFQEAISLKQEGSLRSLTEPVVQRENKIHAEFENDMAGMDRQGRDEDCPSQSDDGLHSSTDSEQEDEFSFFREETIKGENQIQIEDATAGLDKQEQQHDRECNFDSYDGHHEHSNLKPEDSFRVVEEISEEIKVEASMEEMVIMHDVAGELHCELQPDSLLKQEGELKQEIESLVQIQGMGNCIDVLDHDQNKATNLYDKSQPDSKYEFYSEVQIQGKLSGMDVLDQEDLKQDSGLAPQKWANWVGGVGMDGLLFWTSENDSSNVMNQKRICTSFVEDIMGFTSMEEDYVGNGAFTVADDREGVLLKELSAFIQEFTVKLQSFCEIEVQLGQTRAMSEFTNEKDTNPVCVMKGNFAPKVEIQDDFNTEEGDGSSSWDGALDTLEKASDSENEDSEGQIWPLPLALDISDIGAATREQDVDRLKQEYNALEKEYKSLQHEINFGCGEEKSGSLETGELNENSDEILDPYVTLFAKCDSDVQGLAFSQKTSSMIEKTTKATTFRDKSSVKVKSLLRMSRLNRMGQALRAIGRKRL